MTHNNPIDQYITIGLVLRSKEDSSVFLRLVNSQMRLYIESGINDATRFSKEQVEKLKDKYPDYEPFEAHFVTTLYTSE